MNSANLNLEEYRCRKCNRVFYVDATQPHALDLDFGCPCGCDDNGERGRDIIAEIRAVAGSCIANCRGIKCYHVVISFSCDDFEHGMKRKPNNQLEFDKWAFFMETGLFEGNIDWDNIHECACSAMHCQGGRQ